MIYQSDILFLFIKETSTYSDHPWMHRLLVAHQTLVYHQPVDQPNIAYLVQSQNHQILHCNLKTTMNGADSMYIFLHCTYHLAVLVLVTVHLLFLLFVAFYDPTSKVDMMNITQQ